MRTRILGTITAAAALLTIAGTATVAAAQPTDTVYTISNDASANAVVAYHRHPDGSLTWAADYATRGLGTGTGLGSQGALAISRNGRWLVAVNAGSNSVTSFAVGNDGSLRFASRAASRGSEPISVTMHRHLVYVLDAGGDGNISGLRLGPRGRLSPLFGSRRRLSGSTTSPEQISFNPAGTVLAVTEKGANVIVTYAVGPNGRPGARNIQASNGAAPYGFAFDRAGQLLVTEAAASALSSYDVSASGDLSVISASVTDGQGAACWLALTPNGREAFAINAHTATISSYAVDANGAVTLQEAVAGGTGDSSAPLDAIVSQHGRDLYVLVSATHQVAAFQIGAGGTLTPLGTVSAPASAGGLVAH